MKLAVTTLAFFVAALLALGMVMLYSSSMAMLNARTHTEVGAQILIQQIIWCALGIAACVVAALLDYQTLRKLAWPLFGIAIVLLVLVLLPLPYGLTKRINGTHRWFILPGMRLQPSELGKIALIIALAWYIERSQRLMHTWKRGILVPGLIIAPILGLIFIEPDRGATALMAGVSGVMLLVGGVRWKYIVPPLLVGAVGFVVVIWRDPLRLKRILSWLDLEEHKAGAGYQAYHAMLALGSGGWTGLGLGNGRQKLGFVPEHHTDFIFSIIGEELGLIATLLVVLAFIVIVLCGIYIAINARDTFGFLLGVGITFLIGFQAFINIGVVTSALPNKGLPLPFISYGGSNLMTMLGCVGLLLSIARHSPARDAVVMGKAVPTDELPAAQPT